MVARLGRGSGSRTHRGAGEVEGERLLMQEVLPTVGRSPVRERAQLEAERRNSEGNCDCS